MKTRIDKKATNITVLAAIGVRRCGQKVLLAIRNIGGESKAAWSAFLGDLDARGLKRPAFVVADGAPGLEAALTARWGEDLPIQRCREGPLKKSPFRDSTWMGEVAGSWDARSEGTAASGVVRGWVAA